MRNFTQDERNLMMLYSPGTLPGLCEALRQVKEQLGEDEEEELCTLVDTVLSKFPIRFSVLKTVKSLNECLLRMKGISLSKLVLW